MNGFLGEIDRALDRNLTPAVKRIFVINVVVGLALLVFRLFPVLGDLPPLAVKWLGLYPAMILRGAIWQFVTYMFVHVDPFHLLFNMLVLWFFAPELENRWGSRRFWRFYLVTGGGAGLLHFLISMLMYFGFHQRYELGAVIGASGALYGVMLAFAAYNPNAMVIFFIFPMQMKYLMAILIFFMLFYTAPGVSGLTHLLGLLIAYVFLANYHRDWDIRHWRWR